MRLAAASRAFWAAASLLRRHRRRLAGLLRAGLLRGGARGQLGQQACACLNSGIDWSLRRNSCACCESRISRSLLLHLVQPLLERRLFGLGQAVFAGLLGLVRLRQLALRRGDLVFERGGLFGLLRLVALSRLARSAICWSLAAPFGRFGPSRPSPARATFPASSPPRRAWFALTRASGRLMRALRRLDAKRSSRRAGSSPPRPRRRAWPPPGRAWRPAPPRRRTASGRPPPSSPARTGKRPCCRAGRARR